MCNEKHKFIRESWKNQLITFGNNYFNLSAILLPEKTKRFLSEVGLPLLGFNYQVKFLPITYASLYEFEGNKYYILGDLNINASAFSLLGIMESSEEVFRIARGRKLRETDKEVSFLNSDISKFVLFLTHICLFYKKYHSIKYSSINKYELEKDYEILKSCFEKEDKDALWSQSYWSEKLAYIDIDFGDIFYPTPIEDPNKERNVNQESDGEDLPF